VEMLGIEPRSKQVLPIAFEDLTSVTVSGLK